MKESWQRKFCSKLVAVMVSGIFLFSELTWTAKPGIRYFLPEEVPLSAQIPQDQYKIPGIVEQITHEIASFLMPAASAQELGTYGAFRNSKKMSGFSAKNAWRKPCDAVAHASESDKLNTPVSEPLREALKKTLTKEVAKNEKPPGGSTDKQTDRETLEDKTPDKIRDKVSSTDHCLASGTNSDKQKTTVSKNDSDKKSDKNGFSAKDRTVGNDSPKSSEHKEQPAGKPTNQQSGQENFGDNPSQPAGNTASTDPASTLNKPSTSQNDTVNSGASAPNPTLDANTASGVMNTTASQKAESGASQTHNDLPKCAPDSGKTSNQLTNSQADRKLPGSNTMPQTNSGISSTNTPTVPNTLQTDHANGGSGITSPPTGKSMIPGTTKPHNDTVSSRTENAVRSPATKSIDSASKQAQNPTLGIRSPLTETTGFSRQTSVKNTLTEQQTSQSTSQKNPVRENSFSRIDPKQINPGHLSKIAGTFVLDPLKNQVIPQGYRPPLEQKNTSSRQKNTTETFLGDPAGLITRDPITSIDTEISSTDISYTKLKDIWKLTPPKGPPRTAESNQFSPFYVPFRSFSPRNKTRYPSNKSINPINKTEKPQDSYKIFSLRVYIRNVKDYRHDGCPPGHTLPSMPVLLRIDTRAHIQPFIGVMTKNTFQACERGWFTPLDPKNPAFRPGSNGVYFWEITI